jgi:chromosome segregation ATPase
MGKRCPSKDVQSAWLEQAVWDEIEAMLRQPERALERLRQRLSKERKQLAGRRAQLAGLQESLQEKGQERDRVLGLYRRGRISEAAVDRQMQEIAEEEGALQAQVVELSRSLSGVDTEAMQLEAAARALEKLRPRLDEPSSGELRRSLIESLVEQVRVDTREITGNRVATVTVSYRLSTCPTIRPMIGVKDARSLPDRAPKFDLQIKKSDTDKRVA